MTEAPRQLSLLAPDLPVYQPRRQTRRDDPSTSRAAARSAAGVRGADARAILDELGAADRPLASPEIAERIGRPAVAIARRMAELRRAELIRVADDHYRTQSGRKAQRWVLHQTPCVGSEPTTLPDRTDSPSG